MPVDELAPPALVRGQGAEAVVLDLKQPARLGEGLWPSFGQHHLHLLGPQRGRRQLVGLLTHLGPPGRAVAQFLNGQAG
jgi:hypothetical protein